MRLQLIRIGGLPFDFSARDCTSTRIMAREYILRTPASGGNAPAFVRRAMTWAKATNELHGLLRGVLADGVINASEAQFIRGWFRSNQDTLTDPLVLRLFGRLERVFDDGQVTESELDDLKVIFTEYVGDRDAHTPTPLPLNNPAPDVTIPGRSFCFTGTFVSGTRVWCHDQTVNRGGAPRDSVNAGLHYLVIGSKVSAAWANQSYGRKIEAAAGLRDSGAALAIVAEDHWLSHLK